LSIQFWPGWGEGVAGDGVFEGLSGVGLVGRDDENLAGVDGADIATAEVEAQGAAEDEADLLVGVGVDGDEAAFGEDETGEHGLGSVDGLTGEERVELLDLYVGPAVVNGVDMRSEPFVGEGL
jgi:hypothetical protein